MGKSKTLIKKFSLLTCFFHKDGQTMGRQARISALARCVQRGFYGRFHLKCKPERDRTFELDYNLQYCDFEHEQTVSAPSARRLT